MSRLSQDPAFDPPIGGIIIDLPAPLSVNRLWRASKSSVIKSSRYKAWIKRADDMLLTMGQLRGLKPITGKFTALIVVKRSLLDLDNNSKCLLDYLQSRNFIVDDKLCEELTLRWGDAPTGARVTLKPFGPQSVNDVLRSVADRLECSA